PIALTLSLSRRERGLFAACMVLFAAGCNCAPKPPTGGEDSGVQGSAPVIASFVAQPAAIVVGQSSTLKFDVSGADALAIDEAVGDVSGKSSVAVSPGSTTLYT